MPCRGLDGKVAVVTGAADGIGRAVCVELARCGARVWATDVLAAELDGTAAACAEAGGRCRVWPLDVTEQGQVQAAVGEVVAADGAVEVLVNVAGGGLGQVGRPGEEVTGEEWSAAGAGNPAGAFHCRRGRVPLMKGRGCGP